MLSYFFKFILYILGWKAKTNLPGNKKYIILVAPHTSNWDYILGIIYFLSIRLKVRVLMKKELFVFPVKRVLKKLGAIPVDRSNKTNIRQNIIDSINESDQYILVLTPEGTRKRVDNWKKGFHEIALKANIPILLGYLDYEKKELGTGPFFYPSNSLKSDMIKINAFYINKIPKKCNNFVLDNTTYE